MTRPKTVINNMIQNKIPLLNLLSSVSQITAQIILSKLGFKASIICIDIIVYLIMILVLLNLLKYY
jgi:hypothetical protein